MRPVVPMAIAVVLAVPVLLEAQRGAGGPASTPRQAAAIDLTGYWVSVVSEDWRLRMVTPARGVYDGLPLNADGRRAADAWDPERDEAAGEQCRAYGAANVMRMPGRLRIDWADDRTLRIETDAGMQTRLLRFGQPPAPDAAPSWQGHSVAEWRYAAGGGRGTPRLGSLAVVTTRLRPGYVRTNGVPYSAGATVTEYFDVNTFPNGDRWLTITTRVDDPVYFTRPYLTTTDFKQLPDGTGWNPAPCAAR